MIIFRTFLKILQKNKFIVILYAVFLVAFGGVNAATNSANLSFVAEKPDVVIFNHDTEIGVTQNLMDFLRENTNVVEMAEDKIDDALFYRDVNFAIYIPENYRADFLAGKNPALGIKSTGDGQAAFVEMLLTKYLKFAQAYFSDASAEKNTKFESEILAKLNETLALGSNVEMKSKLDTSAFSKAMVYFSFANYSILGCLIYVICLILASFKEASVWKRTIVSATNVRKINRELMLANGLFAFVLWLIYAGLSFVLVGTAMWSVHGMIFLANSLIFTICATALAFLIGNLVTSKNAINGIVNIVALGSSFLCGAFVPMAWLPEGVLNFAHILPSYYFVKNNGLIMEMENVDYESLQPILVNMLIIVGFVFGFVIAANVVARLKRKRSQ